MSAARHTPGPWFVKRPGVIAERATGELVATCGFRARVGSEEEDANARLISKSPDLLAALQRLTFAAQCRDNTMGDPCRLLEVKAELAAAAAAASTIIAETEGR